MSECMNEIQVQSGFLAAPPLIVQQIQVLNFNYPSLLRDIGTLQEFPLGNGTTQTELIYRNRYPQVERGWKTWNKLESNTGCNPCAGQGCGYNPHGLGGHAFQRKLTEMMTKDFRSEGYCVKTIQTTAHFMQTMEQIINGLYLNIAFHKEVNIMQNALTGIAKKYIVTNQPYSNTENVYVYPAKGNAVLSNLSFDIIEWFYEFMTNRVDAVPFGISNGCKIFAMMCSKQLLSHLYRDNAQVRQDLHFSSAADDLINRYGFNYTIRDQFIPVPIQFPRRFDYSAGAFVEVAPMLNDLPGDTGTYSDLNPAWVLAPYEEVIFTGKNPFTILYMPTATTLGGNSFFGTEFAFLDNLRWINPQTEQDPLQRFGFFMTEATIGIKQQYSESVYAVLVARPSYQTMGQFNPPATCPPVDVDCNNDIPSQLCPCPAVTSSSISQVTGNPILTFAVPLPDGTEVGDTVNIGVDTGGYVVGTVVAISADLKAAEFTFTVDVGDCNMFTTVACNDSGLVCSTSVLSYRINCTDDTLLDLVLSTPIKAVTPGNTVTLFYGDGSTDTSVTVVSADMETNTWVVDTGGTAFCDDVNGVIAICVPTATDASCPGCDGVSYTQCES